MHVVFTAISDSKKCADCIQSNRMKRVFNGYFAYLLIQVDFNFEGIFAPKYVPILLRYALTVVWLLTSIEATMRKGICK